MTKPLFLDNTYLYALLVNITELGKDEVGHYFIPDRTIYYPQGGGQRSDRGYISYGNNQKTTILSAKYTEDGSIKHYTENELSRDLLNCAVGMHIFQDDRKLNAAHHLAGHWLSQVVCENMQLPLAPIKGHHHPGESYIEFEGDIKCLSEDIIERMQMVMRIDLQANLKVKAEFATAGDALFEAALLPKNFKPPLNKPLRFVTIETYKPVPCGGTHLDSLREIKSVLPVQFYKKGGKVRLSYRCEMESMVAA